MKITQDISMDRIQDLLCSAFEGGSNYWYQIEGYEVPNGTKFEDYCEGGNAQPDDDYRHWATLIPAKGGIVRIIDQENTDEPVYNLDIAAMQRGLQLMADKLPRYYADFMAENDDAETGDVFLQLCLFGEVVYG